MMWKCFRARSYGYGERAFVPRWGMIIPHTQAAQGAMSYDDTYTEYVYGSVMVPMVNVPFALRNSGGVKEAAKKLNSLGVNATIEPHYNAFNGMVRGAEILVLQEDGLSKHFAELFLDIFKESYPDRKIRGVKEVKPGDRGYSNLLKSKQAGNTVAMLSEMFFGDNFEDWLAPNEQAAYWRDCLGSNVDNKIHSKSNDTANAEGSSY